jgi:hypothetical protein
MSFDRLLAQIRANERKSVSLAGRTLTSHQISDLISAITSSNAVTALNLSVCHDQPTNQPLMSVMTTIETLSNQCLNGVECTLCSEARAVRAVIEEQHNASQALSRRQLDWQHVVHAFTDGWLEAELDFESIESRRMS